MITTIKHYRSRLAIIHNIPKSFFRKIDASTEFNDDLFPSWAVTVFAKTDLKEKFKKVYDDYKGLANDAQRQLVQNCFKNMNKVQELCENSPEEIRIYTLNDLPKSIQDSIKTLFIYLYDSALEYHRFEEFVDSSVSESIDNYLQINSIQVCPFCGIESYLNLEGQARLPLDHWLDKSKYPVASVNHKNLIPIGLVCNGRGVKGDKNILLNGTERRYQKVYYPLLKDLQVSVSFKFITEPIAVDFPDESWDIEIKTQDPNDQIYIQSWDWIMNLKKRYRDYFKKDIFDQWESRYSFFVNDPDNELNHASNIIEFKSNLKRWRGSFRIKGEPGAILYRAFIDYLINNASDAYLTGLYENLRR